MLRRCSFLLLCYLVTIFLCNSSAVLALSVGVTHAPGSCDPTGNTAATARALSLLANGVIYQNQMIYGNNNNDVKTGNTVFCTQNTLLFKFISQDSVSIIRRPPPVWASNFRHASIRLILLFEKLLGSFDWTGLTRRITIMRQTNGTAILTLYGAPDWMKARNHFKILGRNMYCSVSHFCIRRVEYPAHLIQPWSPFLLCHVTEIPI